MSLFASLGQGDIWALSGISFESPINDLLEKGEFTLENLLEEDELIQEVKAKNERLIEYLAGEGTVGHLLDFIIINVDHGASDMRAFKYPYMSCEVICCEVPEILHVLVESNNGIYLDKLFTFLDNPKKLDYYLAGYFEKILEMLFRRMTVPMMKYFNDAGTTLLARFLRHMDNYSIMQIVQRLMLPHIPFANLDSEGDMTDEERMLRQCNWSFSTSSCQMLFERMLDPKDPEVPLHISDLLITVLQLSPPETLVISYLCESSCIERLASAIVGEILEGGVESSFPVLDIASPGDAYSSAASVSLAAISVLESLNSRLFEASLPFDQGMGQITEGSQEHLIAVREQIDGVCATLLRFVPRIHAALHDYLTKSPCKPFVGQGKHEVQRLGHRGLQLVKLVESVVRLGNDGVDDCACQCGLFRTCVELMFHFESNSFLHLSVQRIIITVLEIYCSIAQRHLLTECGLLGALMGRIGQYSTTPSAPLHQANGGSSSADGGVVGNRLECESMTPKHSSVMGNLLIVAQALSLALDMEQVVPGTGDAQAQGTGGVDTTGTSFLTDSSVDGAEAGKQSLSGAGQTPAGTAEDAGNSSQVTERPGRLRGLLSGPVASAQGAAGVSLVEEWDFFVEHALHSILDHQMVGSYSAIANLSAMSQDDPTKLGVDLEMYNMGGQNAAGDRAGFSGLHAEMSAEEWHQQQRNQYGEEDEDEDFMFQGPATASVPFHGEDGGGPTSFHAAFDFTKRQDFSATGFGLDDRVAAHASPAVEAFADFAAFEGDSSPGISGGVDESSTFADFAAFADFPSSDHKDDAGAENVADAQVDDFAPSVF